MTVHGVGFIGNSVVRVGETALPTTFVNIRTLRAKVPAQNRTQTLKLSVFNAPPDGGLSNSIFLKNGSTGIPELSAIVPYRVVEGNPEFDITVTGAGFVPTSLVRAGDTTVPTTFIDAQTLRVRIPAELVARALPNRFNAPGPGQNNGIYGDRTMKVIVANGPSTSNSLSLRIVAKWLANEKE